MRISSAVIVVWLIIGAIERDLDLEASCPAALLERDCLLAILPLEHTAKMQTSQGETDALKFHAFDLSGKEPEDLGTGMFFQDVLVRMAAGQVREVLARRARHLDGTVQARWSHATRRLPRPHAASLSRVLPQGRLLG